MRAVHYPRTIHDGHGTALTFLDRTAERLELEGVLAPGHGHPLHKHRDQQEVVRVREGQLSYQLGPDVGVAGPGDTLVFPRDVPHRFFNAGEGNVLIQGHVSPPGHFEDYLTAMYESVRKGKNGRPRRLDAIRIVRRYRGEFDLVRRV